MRRAASERGRTWPETATRTVTSIRCGIIYFTEVRHDWRPWNRPASRGRGPSWPSQVQRCQHERATEGRCPTSSRDGDDWRMSGPILRWRGLASSPTHQRCRTSHGQRQRRVPGAAGLTIGSPLRPTASAVGATNGTIALAKVTQSGWSGAILARPTDCHCARRRPDYRERAPSSGAPMKPTMLPIQAGDDLVRNTSDGGVRRYRLPSF